MTRTTIVLALSLAVTQAAPASAAERPAGRNKPVAAFDPTRKTIVLFGGFATNEPAVLQDAWERTGDRWQGLVRSAFPGRAAAGVATDTKRGRIVLFGGEDGAGVCGDTLEWDGKAWKRVAWSGPPARTVTQLAYDSRRGRTVLFGGTDDKQRAFGDTWEWDGRRWTKMTAVGPAPRSQHVMAYDAARGRVVLFGGNGSTGSVDPNTVNTRLLGDTWEWNGVKWSRVAGPGPSARDHHAMAYDEKRARVVLFGGWDGKFLGDLWEFDGTWKRIDARGPSARGGLPSMMYHPPRQVVLLYGGWGDEGPQTDVWGWNGQSWTRSE